jgi:hypothetical protein
LGLLLDRFDGLCGPKPHAALNDLTIVTRENLSVALGIANNPGSCMHAIETDASYQITMLFLIAVFFADSILATSI